MESIYRREKQVGTWDGWNIIALVEARYEDFGHLLIVDCDFPWAKMIEFEWLPHPVQHMTTAGSKHEAVRVALHLADEWYASVSAKIPTSTE